MENQSAPSRIVTTRRGFLLDAGLVLAAAAATPELLAQAAKTNDFATGKPGSIAVIWDEDIIGGDVEMTYAVLGSLMPAAERNADTKSAGAFSLKPGTKRLEIEINDTHVDFGAKASRVTVRFRPRNEARDKTPRAFTFFLRDVRSDTPILLRGLQVAVVPAKDPRKYSQIASAVEAKKLKSLGEAIDAAPEESYESACRGTKEMRCPTWLGVGRDMRIFRVMPWDSTGYWGYIEPYDLVSTALPKDGKYAGRYCFILGRGARCAIDIKRRLDDGTLPIVKSTQIDDDIEYHLTLFATLEKEPLAPDNVRGTHWLAAYANSTGAMLSDKELAQYKELAGPEVSAREQELICWVHVEVVNTGKVPRYAYTKAGYIKANALEGVGNAKFIGGLRIHPNYENKVICISQLNGKPMPQEEMALLLQPGEKITLDYRFPHRPLPRDRAAAVAQHDYETHYQACRKFWQAKLARGAQVSLPDPAVTERVRAGLLHLDILTLGHANEGPLATPVGWYAPIGSESSPIIQFYDALGYHDVAERALDFFLHRQRADGFIQTCLGYQLETGPVLWTIGEHFRHTRNVAWARRVQPHVLKACQYLLAWRRRNMKDELRGKGYGLLEGKVADPQDFYHSYMLNALSYLGLKRAVEVYEHIDASAFAEVKGELAPYLTDIRESYRENVARSPVIPLGDGSWVPSFSPWPEYAGPVSLFADGGSWLSHQMFASRDSLIGSLYLGIGEVLDPNEPLAGWLLKAHQELMTHRNAGFSQPYYCRHDWLHLKRGEPRQFLKTYFNQFASLQDRETYTFWEHYVGVGESQHKTHEEAWFLMQTRWMLWHEDYESGTLHLLSMIPRAWLAAGKVIKLQKCASHFGPFTLEVRPGTKGKSVEATVEFHGPAEQRPQRVTLRLPHSEGPRKGDAKGGNYVVATESVEFKPAVGVTRISLRYT